MLRTIVTGLLGHRERRLNAFDDKYYAPIYLPTKAGVNVDSDSALNYRPVYSAIRLLSQSTASLPLILYRRLKSGGKDRATDDPMYELIGLRPNTWQNHFTFIEMMMGHLLLRGNAYAHIQRTGRGTPTGLTPLHPGRVETELLSNGQKVHHFEDSDGNKFDLPGEDVLHVVGQSHDGVIGMSPISFLREVIGLGLALEEHGSRLFSNGARPGGVLEHPGKLSNQAREHLKQSFSAEFGGVKNAHKLAVLEEGLKWSQVGLTSEDAQFLDSRRFQIEEIAGAFAVPPHMIGDLSRATFSNIEHQATSFVQYSLLPWLRRWEESLNLTILPQRMRGEFYFEFLVDAFQRGDTVTRYNAYAVGRQNGFLSANDIRAMENMNPIEGGDEYLSPMNMVPMGTDPASEDDEPPQAGDPPKLRRSAEKMRESFRKALISATSKVTRRESKEIATAFKRIDAPDFIEKWQDAYRKHAFEALDGIVSACKDAAEFCQCDKTPEIPSRELVDQFSKEYADRSIYLIESAAEAGKLGSVFMNQEEIRSTQFADRIIDSIWEEA